MKKLQRKEKPVLSTLLIMALVLNSTMVFVLLANRDRLMSPPAKAVAESGVASVSSRSSQMEKKKTFSAVVSRLAGTQSRRPKSSSGLAKTAVVTSGPVRKQRARGKEEIVFLPSPRLYTLSRETILVSRKEGTRILLPKGTIVHVTGFADGDRALVVSRRGRPDGFIPKTLLRELTDDEDPMQSSPARSEATGRSVSPKASLPARVAGGPYGGSIALGPAYIYVSRNGQVSGNISR